MDSLVHILITMMGIRLLDNPLTSNFYDLKNVIKDVNFPWYFKESSTEHLRKDGYIDMPSYAHPFLKRPELNNYRYPYPISEYLDLAATVCLQILSHNNIDCQCFLRIAANCIHPQKQIYKSIPHEDHNFKHKNLIIYYTNSGGKTMCEDDEHDPKENDVILFNGEHYMESPVNDRRIILVSTFIE